MPVAATSRQPLIRHDIAVGNLIWGSAHFLSLRLPEVWDIAPGVGRPEVVAAHDRAGRKWIASGQAWYVLYHREHHWAMELKLDSRPLGRVDPAPGGAATSVHGHEAFVRRWQRRRGLFRPKVITFVEVAWRCDHSDRTLRVELSGRCPPEGFEQMLALIPEWWCH
jgi:hypothetical protein